MTNGKKFWVDEVMESLHGMERAEAPPFLFTRIEARINSMHASPNEVSKPVMRLAFAGACLLMCLNVCVWLQPDLSSDNRQTETTSAFFEGNVNYQLYQP